MLLNNHQIMEDIKGNQNVHRNKWKWKNDNLWDSVKAVLSKRFIVIQAYLKKQEKNQINNVILHLKPWEKRRHEEPQN